MKKFNITTRTHELYGFKIPVGKMYGVDAKGVWICTDYRINKMKVISKPHYAQMRDENGVFKSVMIRPAKSVPVMTIWRLRQTTNRIWWEQHKEYGKTIDKILELIDRFPEKTIDIPDPTITHSLIYDSAEKKWVIKEKRKVTGNSAKKVSASLIYRTVPEFQPFARPY